MRNDGTKRTKVRPRGLLRVLLAGAVAAGLGLVGVPAQADVGEDASGDAATVTAGYANSCVVSAAALVWCWGDNFYGQLGIGTQGGNSKVPVRVVGLDDVAAVSVDMSHACAMKIKGEVYCWGRVGGAVVTTPQFMIDKAASVAVGSELSCAVLRTGDVSCWGDAATLGFSAASPTPLPYFRGVRSLAIGLYAVCALGTDSAVRCVGSNHYGGLGNGSPTGTYVSSARPVFVLDPSGGKLSGIVSLSSSILHTCAIRSNGEVLCWGWNSFGQTGSGSGALTESIPVVVRGLGPAQGIATGFVHTCALVGNDTYCWGDGSSNQLNGAATSPAPVDVGLAGPDGDLGWRSSDVWLDRFQRSPLLGLKPLLPTRPGNERDPVSESGVKSGELPMCFCRSIRTLNLTLIVGQTSRRGRTKGGPQ